MNTFFSSLQVLIFIVFGIITLVFENGDENQREYGLSPVITTALHLFYREKWGIRPSSHA